ncbi:MAG: hypothetical protein ABSG41_00670 [Bryobacteraceae bacterium]|jgi:hypothetical protein
MATASDKESLLVKAAKTDGTAARTLASLGGIAPGIGTKKRLSSDGKFEKKHKHRLPRLVKKAMKAKAERAALQA